MTPTTEAEAPPLGLADHDGLADAGGLIPAFGPAAIDAAGRPLPLSTEMRRARSDALRRTLAVIATEPDTDRPGTDLEVMRWMNEAKPERPPFPELP